MTQQPDLQSAKATVRAHYQALAQATPETVEGILSQTMTADATWRGFHPFNDQTGAKGAADAFWQPYLQAMSRVQRREDIFIAGENSVGDGIWTASMGHLLGLFDAPFLNIPPTRKITMLRYCEFNRVDNGKITDTAFYCDVLHLMAQAGITPLPDATAAQLVQPGPMTHDGLLYETQNPATGQATLDLINKMIGDINTANSAEKPLTPQEELAQTWADDMLWWGPTGIGATFTIDRYIEQHQRPFRTLTSDREFYGHVCRMAEGNYGGFFGRPNLSIVPTGDYLGLPATHKRAPMRVIDMYRRDGDKLAENWIFIDMLHFLKEQGIDILKTLPEL